MVVKIRLARLSRRNQPLYNIIVAQARSARDSKPMEVLGTYDPTPRTPLASHDTPAKVLDPITGTLVPYQPRQYKDVKLDITRTKYWLGVGAQPSEGVQGLFSLLGLWEARPGTTTTTTTALARPGEDRMQEQNLIGKERRKEEGNGEGVGKVVVS